MRSVSQRHNHTGTRDYDDGKARRYIPGITDEENALVNEEYYHDRTSGQEGKEF